METKIVKVNPKDIKLLKLNARYMKASEFRKLVDNVKRDGCLTQLPFCAYNDDMELEVLSGNHRVQAAIEAGLEEIEVQMTEEKLTNSQKIGIQLSHNSISGQDDMAILKELYEAIDDVEMKAYSGLDDETLDLLENIKTQSMSLGDLQYKVLNILFLPSEIEKVKASFEEAKKVISKNETFLARYEDYDKYLDTQVEVSKGTLIKNTALTFMAMLEIVNNHIEDLKEVWISESRDKDWVPISTIVNRGDMMASDAKIVNKAVDLAVSRGEAKQTQREKALAVIAKHYIENNKKKGK